MLGRMKVRGLTRAYDDEFMATTTFGLPSDEQTDDFCGFPRRLGECDNRHPRPHPQPERSVSPPCTGYDRDYELTERLYADKPGY